MEFDRNNRKAKKWYHEECYNKRKTVLNILRELRKILEDIPLNEAYTEERRQYKRMIKNKKTIYSEKKIKEMAEEAQKDPHIALRPRKCPLTQHIQMQEWETHFTEILSKDDPHPISDRT